MKKIARLLAWISLSCLLLTTRAAMACPFCSAMTETLREQMGNMDAVVIAELLKTTPVEAEPKAADGKVPCTGTFRMLQTLKGQPLLAGVTEVETIYVTEVGQGIGQPCLMMGVGPSKLMWSAPTFLNERVRQYVQRLPQLPTDDAERLTFFASHLEDPEEILARDAYEEFARAPYPVVKAIRGAMKHDRLVQWIQDTKVPVSRKRLYFTMLGICGSKNDLPLLQELMQSTDRSVRSGLDALIACHLTLAGAEGMPLVEKLFLRNDQAEYADTYAAIMALRFHGSETDVVPKPRLLEGMRAVLSRPPLADLVIADLARWEDWSAMPRLVQLFKEANEDNSWVRVPVVNYLRTCPLPEAKVQLAELEKIDPDAVKRAGSLLPFGGGGPATRPEKK